MKIAAYLEDYPTAESVVSHGMSRVNGRLLSCLLPELQTLLVNRAGAWWRDEQLAERLRPLRRPGRLLRRVQDALASRLAGFAELPLLAWWLKISGGVHEGDLLFCPCGADANSAVRAYRLARAARLRPSLYLVDDFAESHRLAHGKALPAPLASELAEAIKGSQILTISKGLQARMREQYGVSSHVVPLPYPETTPPESAKPLPQILFVGNVSHFYQDGLRDLAEVMAEIHRETGADLKLRITLGKPEAVAKTIGSYPFIVCGNSGGSDDLSREISQSLLCFLPYSFHEEYRVMVSTSFPSKLLDYLASARSILCYAPPYATSTDYFKTHALPQTLDHESRSELKRILLDHLREEPNHSTQYRRTLNAEHSSTKVRQYLAEALLS